MHVFARPGTDVAPTPWPQERGPLVVLSRWRIEVGLAGVLMVFALAAPTWASIGRSFPLVVAGLALRTWARGHLRRAVEVAVTGPYAHHRHPLYLGSFLVGLGFALMTDAWIPPALFVAVFFAMYVPKVMREERFLRAKYGRPYVVYADRVPGLLWRAAGVHDSIDRHRFSWWLVRKHCEWHTWLGATGVLAVFCLMAMNVLPEGHDLVIGLMKAVGRH